MYDVHVYKVWLLQIERSLAKMVFVLLLLWIFSWTPYAILASWTIFSGGATLTQKFAVVPTVMCKLSGTFNGFIYGVRRV